MNTNLVTKFAVANQQNVAALLTLINLIVHEKFSGKLPARTIEKYLEEKFSEKMLISEMNDLSNQWLIVYSDDLPVGCARVTTKGEKPDAFAGQRVQRIADFGILQAWNTMEVQESLLLKCLNLGSLHDIIWINEYTGSSLIGLFKDYGFKEQNNIIIQLELPLASICMVKMK